VKAITGALQGLKIKSVSFMLICILPGWLHSIPVDHFLISTSHISGVPGSSTNGYLVVQANGGDVKPPGSQSPSNHNRNLN